MTDFYSRLETIQKSKKAKRMDISRATGIPESTIRGWITRQPALDAAYKVAQFFNVSLDWLAGGEVKYSNSDLKIGKEERELLLLFNRFDERDKNTLLDMARTINKHYLSMVAENISGE